MTSPREVDAGLVTIVEDDPAIAEGLALNLKLLGYESTIVGDAEAACQRIEQDCPDLVLLDITLPKQSGLWVLERLRGAENHVPVIVLSARQDEYDKVAALRLGADDYISKPFALAELLARIAAVLRRARLDRSLQRPRAAPSLLRFGKIAIDLKGRTISRDGCPVKLTHLEFELVSFLCRKPGLVHSREELLRAVWGLSSGQARTVDNFVAQLRAKLEDDPDRPRHFLTVRGTGYRFVAD